MKWIFRIVALGIVIYAGQLAFHSVVQAHMRYEARKEIKAQLDALPAAQRRAGALALYLGFYWGNARLIPGVCKEEGIDLSDYASAFIDRNAADYSRVRSTFRGMGGSEQALLTAMTANGAARNTVTKVFVRADLSRGSDTMADGCRALLKRKDQVLKSMDFRDMFPYVWDVAEVQ